MPTFAIKRNDTLPRLRIQAIEKGSDPALPIDLRPPNPAWTTTVYVSMIRARHEIAAVNVPTITSLNANAYNLRLQIDNFDPVTIDVTGNLGVTPQDYTIATIIENINTALEAVDASLSRVAREREGKINLISPSNTSVSRIIIHNDNQEVRFNAISQVFGIATNSGDVNSNEGSQRTSRVVMDHKEVTDVSGINLATGILDYQLLATETALADLYLAEFSVEYFNGVTPMGKRSVPLSLTENLFISVLPDIDAQ